MVEEARVGLLPGPLAKYEDVVADRRLFMSSLEKLHSFMGTKFMIPIIGGRDLDLHKLFVEVTSRGGIAEILKEKRWKEVTSTFNFPSTATNASFVLRKYYYSLLHHYEQIYYFKLHAAAAGPSSTPGAVQGLPNNTLQPTSVPNIDLPRMTTTVDSVSSVSAASPAGTPVIGVIDGKFDGGYLVTVRIGKDTLKGVLYQTPPSTPHPPQQPSNISTVKTNSPPKTRKRKRRKKSELRKRDPSHPKPNRSGYNFFFSEQHARLKPLHPGRDREISRKIGELWNNLEEHEKAVYQEKAMRDKERYRMEMEDYREKQKENQVISDAVPLRQRFPFFHVDMGEGNLKDGSSQPNFTETREFESESSKSETEDDDEEESFSETETSPAVGVAESGNAEEFQIVQEDEKGFEESEASFGDGDGDGETKHDSPHEPQN